MICLPATFCEPERTLSVDGAIEGGDEVGGMLSSALEDLCLEKSSEKS